MIAHLVHWLHGHLCRNCRLSRGELRRANACLRNAVDEPPRREFWYSEAAMYAERAERYALRADS